MQLTGLVCLSVLSPSAGVCLSKSDPRAIVVTVRHVRLVCVEMRILRRVLVVVLINCPNNEERI